jgi:uncharacterized membrane protein YhaH (DUF805 family)
MNTIFYFLVQIALTLIVSALIAGYLRSFLRKVLVDLCGTQDRAQFWTSFSNVLLIGMPMVFALNYKPEADTFETAFLEIAGKLGGNLAGLLFALMGLGFAVSIFALFAPRTSKAEAK